MSATVISETITKDELKSRNRDSQLLIAIDGRVFDVTVWASKHPGGREILQAVAGTDATDVFYAFHPPGCPHSACSKVLDRLPCVAKIESANKSELQRDFELLRNNANDIGLYSISLAYYCRIWAWLATIFSLSVILTLRATSCTSVLMASAVSALFLQQSAFVGHDSGHLSVTFSPTLDWGIGVVFGPLLTGLSISWWKHSHNLHHVETNNSERDPDIQHLPLFALSEKVIRNGGVYSYYHGKFMPLNSLAGRLVSHQHILFLPVMFFARFNLYAQGFLFFWSGKYRGPAWKGVVEVGAMLFHQLIVFLLVSSLPSAKLAVLWILATNGLAGILNLQITTSHFGQPVLDSNKITEFEDAPFLLHQLATTTDIDTTWNNSWFFGGLERQVAHHIFPRMPRKNLDDAAAMIKFMCRRHGVEYKSQPFARALREVFTALRRSAKVAKTRGQE